MASTSDCESWMDVASKSCRMCSTLFVPVNTVTPWDRRKEKNICSLVLPYVTAILFTTALSIVGTIIA